MKEIELREYKITWDKIESSEIPVSLEMELEDVYRELEDPRSYTLKRLKRLIKKYPANLQLRNYLSVVYHNMGNLQKAEQVNEETLRKFPDYFFARVNKARSLLEEGRFEEMENMIGKGFDLSALYPERDVFHITEFMAMQLLAISFYVETEDLDQAESRLELIKEVDPEAFEIEQMQTRIIMAKARLRWLKDREMAIETEVDFKSQYFKQPAYNFDITQQLFDFGLTVPESVWQQFLEKDRKKVLEDLENLLRDQYFNFDEDQEYPEHEALVNAIFILGEMEAGESLPTVLEMMGQTDRFFDMMLGDLFNELGWIPLVKMGKNKLSLLEDYLKLPAKHTYFRTVVTDALAQIYQHFPEKREQIIEIYKRILDFYDQAELEDNIIDNEFNGLLIADFLDLNLKQFLPQIESLYKKGYVHPTICGPYEEVEKELKSGKTNADYHKRKLLSLKEIYEDLAQYERDHYEESIDLDESFGDLLEYDFNSVDTYEREHKKIGRNDPCPCGSGKKFKKCCLAKGIYD